MTNFTDLQTKRRSIYGLGKDVELSNQELIDTIQGAVLNTPTAFTVVLATICPVRLCILTSVSFLLLVMMVLSVVVTASVTSLFSSSIPVGVLSSVVSSKAISIAVNALAGRCWRPVKLINGTERPLIEHVFAQVSKGNKLII